MSVTLIPLLSLQNDETNQQIDFVGQGPWWLLVNSAYAMTGDQPDYLSKQQVAEGTAGGGAGLDQFTALEGEALHLAIHRRASRSLQ